MTGFKKSAEVKSDILKKGLTHLLCACTGTLLSGVGFISSSNPFGLSFAGGAESEYLISSAAGAATGYLLFCNTMDSLQNVSAVALVCFIRLGTENLFSHSKQRYLSTVCVLISSFICSMIITAATGFDVSAVLLSLCTAVISAAGAFFFSRMENLLFSDKRISCTRPADSAAVFLSIGAVLLSFDRLTGGYISIPHLAASFLILTLSYSRKTTTTFIAGIALGAVTGFGDNEQSLLFALPAAGLLTGISGEYGKGASAAGLIISDLLSLVLNGGDRSPLIFICESFVCVITFCLIPATALSRAGELLSQLCCETVGEDSRKALSFRLMTAAKTVRDIGISVQEVNRILQKTEIPEPDELFRSVKNELCTECSKKDFCWRTYEKTTQKAFINANSILKEKGRLTIDSLPERLSNVCRCPENLCDSFNRFLCEYYAKLSARDDIFETKELAAMQFLNAGDVLCDAASSLYDDERDDPVTAAAAEETLREFGFMTETVIAFSDSRDKSIISAYCHKTPRKADFALLTDRLFEKTGIFYMSPSTEKYSDSGTVLNFCEADCYEAFSAVAVKTAPKEKYCGDTCETFFDGKGNFYVILSDGMGRGGRAALDSVMTASITAKLMKAGFSMNCAVNAVNSALMVKSDKETLSTLDVMKLDLSDGTAEFYKAGASFSVVQTGGKTAVIEQSSLPLGILKDVNFECVRTSLSSGDRIIVMSDGAAVLPHETFKEILNKMKNKSIDEVAKAVAETAYSAGPSGASDDITVACVEIR